VKSGPSLPLVKFFRGSDGNVSGSSTLYISRRRRGAEGKARAARAALTPIHTLKE
jgi:hypothetical protein